MAGRDCVKLEEVVECSAVDLERFRGAIFGAMFTRDRAMRDGCIEYLRFNTS